ncbi:hypothetical protein KFK09_002967 [Dendrobium nobile]|uniref:Uncharacterized protein n=1 Tax=Dendrobium nobile TaxID=94219 RepID=A0A8T3C2U4_DENNO|nr:hypothetical protein KFK09_002967 [Dendrobium nobile]
MMDLYVVNFLAFGTEMHLFTFSYEGYEISVIFYLSLHSKDHGGGPGCGYFFAIYSRLQNDTIFS